MAKAKPIVTSEEVQIVYAQTGKILAVTLLIVVCAALLFGLGRWVQGTYGSTGVIVAIMFALLVVLPMAYIMVGVASSNKAQENMGKTVGSMAQLLTASNKSAANVQGVESAKTEGVRQREELKQKQRYFVEEERANRREIAEAERMRPMIEDQQMRESFLSGDISVDSGPDQYWIK